MQGTRVREPEEVGGDGVYRTLHLSIKGVYSNRLTEIRITKDTELGDNDSIKNPPPIESTRSSRRREKGQPVKCVVLYLSMNVEENVKPKLSLRCCQG